jgi:PncC family amidohydrolase
VNDGGLRAPDAASAAAVPAAVVTAAEVIAEARARGVTLATAESLTGGLLSAALTSVPGASRCFTGGVTAYATDRKAAVLGVDPELLAQVGAVHPEVAGAMAEGVRRLMAADYGVATTGVAGPDPQDGHAVGTVYTAVAGPEGVSVVSPRLSGDRATIRSGTVAAALALLHASLVAAKFTE